ncbi:hypothetical protein [Desulfoglaeba alkanexedens]|uniref:hypothetical protein n=1 Tax=Desulfoglaeba alkanexedens TaxID=361111 RepID=UPI001B85F242|nr:hypothetical protein [Desulfoglaeba alkanexedens]
MKQQNSRKNSPPKPPLETEITPWVGENQILQGPVFKALQGLRKLLLSHQVWYNHHWNLRIAVEEGRVKVVDKETYPHRAGARETVQRDIWKGALKSARNVERSYGKKNLGPWDEFEWGMINGKLSAVRWVLGEEWDMLDT